MRESNSNPRKSNSLNAPFSSSPRLGLVVNIQPGSTVLGSGCGRGRTWTSPPMRVNRHSSGVLYDGGCCEQQNPGGAEEAFALAYINTSGPVSRLAGNRLLGSWSAKTTDGIAVVRGRCLPATRVLCTPNFAPCTYCAQPQPMDCNSPHAQYQAHTETTSPI